MPKTFISGNTFKHYWCHRYI